MYFRELDNQGNTIREYNKEDLEKMNTKEWWTEGRQKYLNSLVTTLQPEELFQPELRICRGLNTEILVTLAEEYQIQGPVWALMAGRPLHYLDAFDKFAKGKFVNCERMIKVLPYLRNQAKKVKQIYPEKKLTVKKGDVFIAAQKVKRNFEKPVIMDLDGMGSLIKNYDKILNLVEKDLNPTTKVLFSVTSTLGRGCETKEEYQVVRKFLTDDINFRRRVIYHCSVEYTEPTYPIRVENFVLDRVV